jgi:ribosomal protein L25 (general stress protein Ctc)
MVKNYGNSDSELNINVDETKICRDIVKKIMDFGVRQSAILNIIYFLSLELENREHMLNISSLVKNMKVNFAKDDTKHIDLDLD